MYNFVERWLERAHLVHWLVGNSAISIICAALSAWWVRTTGGSWLGIILAGIGAFVLIFVAIGTFIALLRSLVMPMGRILSWYPYRPCSRCALPHVSESSSPSDTSHKYWCFKSVFHNTTH
jgi:hypothetical protein